MAQMVPLWCGAGGLIDPKTTSDELEVRKFVSRCADHGVTRLFPSGGTKVLVDAAKAAGIDVHPYSALNTHGGMSINYAWSSNYVLPAMNTVEARVILDRHRPIFSHPVTELRVSDYAKANPQYWTKSRNGSAGALVPGERLSLSLAFPDVRAFEQEKFLAMLRSTGAAGLQMELVLGNVDERGVSTGGYEPAVADAFRQRFNKDASQIANDDRDWLQFRASLVTDFMEGFRKNLRAFAPDAKFSTVVIAREGSDYIKVLQDWEAWVDKRLIDEFYLWFRTTSDLTEVERLTSQVTRQVAGRVPVIAELSCYHPGSFQDSRLLVEAAARALASGADAVGVYRSHAVEQLDLWHVLDRIAAM
ncbi:MAG: hypothetical protein FJ314_08770 [SAR202 cluster bacterium]|nr:hypothetical protein [SAR202 cluster bacterium]